MYCRTFMLVQYENGNNLRSLAECRTSRESQQHPEGLTVCTKCDSLYCKTFENYSCSFFMWKGWEKNKKGKKKKKKKNNLTWECIFP